MIDVDRRWPDLGQFIRAQRDAAQMSVRRLADLAGVSNPYLSQIERGLRKPSAEILQQIARALRISVETLYVHAGILDDDDEPRPTVIEAIVGDQQLTHDQRHTLITVYESFRAQNGGAVSAASSAPAEGAAPAHRVPARRAPATPRSARESTRTMEG